METKKLYLVTLKGMKSNYSGSVSRGINYVIAENTNEAYKKVRKYLDEKDLGFSGDRALDKIEVIAEEYQYTDTGYLLFT